MVRLVLTRNDEKERQSFAAVLVRPIEDFGEGDEEPRSRAACNVTLMDEDAGPLVADIEDRPVQSRYDSAFVTVPISPLAETTKPHQVEADPPAAFGLHRIALTDSHTAPAAAVARTREKGEAKFFHVPTLRTATVKPTAAVDGRLLLDTERTGTMNPRSKVRARETVETQTKEVIPIRWDFSSPGGHFPANEV